MVDEKRKKSLQFLSVMIIAIVSFVAGTRYDTIFATVVPVFGIRASSQRLDLSSVQTTYQQLLANYDGKLDTQKLIYGASRGMVAAAGDAHTVYMDPDEAKEFQKSLSGAIGGGIGAEIGVKDNRPAIIKSLDGSPSQKAGIKAGDYIMKVNDEDVSEWTTDKIVAKIRGDIGTSVKLTLVSGTTPREVSVVRQNITAPAVESSVEGEVGILTVSRFNDDTVQSARKAAQEFVNKGVKRVVVDLRNNPGGTVQSAQGLLGLWLNRQDVMSERRGSEVVRTLQSTGMPILADIKTVVLINENSASASEIVAGALRDHGKATLVGKKSYGKGSVQSVIGLPGGAQLKVTEARWYTSKGNNIDKTGITPDVDVDVDEEAAKKGIDNQLEKAKTV